MEKKETQKKRLMWAVVGLAVVLVLVAIWCFASPPDVEVQYAGAVADAVDAEVEEIEPLVALTQTDPMTTWDEEGRVLLLSWNRRPELYPQGEVIRLGKDVWTFTDREIASWYAENKDGVKDWDLRLEQLIGLPSDAGYTHVSAFWAETDDIVRPAYVTDVTVQMQLTFPEGTDLEFKKWFEENSQYSYGESAYPWTRLGYTYDWADNGAEYGLTEFLISEDAPVEVAFTKTTADFLTWLGEGATVEDAA